MPIIDEDGDLFGVANAVDIIIVIVVLIMASGFGFMAVSGQSQPEDTILTQTVTVQIEENGTEIEDLETGPISNPDIIAIHNIDRRHESDALSKTTLTVQLRINSTEEGLPRFDGERLYLGRELELELNADTITGTVTGASEPERIERIPTPTTTQPDTTTAIPTSSETPTTKTTSTSATESHVFTIETTLNPARADKVTEGPVAAPDVNAIQEKTVLAENGSATQLALQIELEVMEQDGKQFFRGVSVQEGTAIKLELESGTIEGTITERKA